MPPFQRPHKYQLLQLPASGRAYLTEVTATEASFSDSAAESSCDEEDDQVVEVSPMVEVQGEQEEEDPAMMPVDPKMVTGCDPLALLVAHNPELVANVDVNNNGGQPIQVL